MGNFEKSWKRSWKVMEFQKLKRVLPRNISLWFSFYHTQLKSSPTVSPRIQHLQARSQY